MSSLSIAAAIPIFFLLIAAEYLLQFFQHRPRARFSDAITSLSCGIGSLIFGLIPPLFVFAIYGYLHGNFALVKFENGSAGAWIVALISVDFCYYWFHRAAHRINFIWATHIVHHSSEDYNLTTALRQSWFGPLLSWAFYLPLAVLGLSPLMIMLARTVNTVFQFWIHTESINKLGPLETILSTPSHHRVHHGVNPEYIDKNYGGILIIWDRLFGTFEPELAPSVYAILHPLRSMSSWWANFHQIVDLFQVMSRLPRLWDKFQLWFRPPQWRPSGAEALPEIPQVNRADFVKFDVEGPSLIRWYVGINFLLISIAITLVLYFSSHRDDWRLWGVCAVILLSMLSFGALLERKRWGIGVELLKTLAIVPLGFFLLPSSDPASYTNLIQTITLVTLVFMMAGWLIQLDRRYFARAVEA